MFSILFIVLLLTLSYLYWSRRDRRLPPGPKGVPLLGTLPFMTKDPPRQLQKWGLEYGGIYTWRCGRDDIVTITDYDIASKLFLSQGEKIITRPSLPVFDLSAQGYGLTFANQNIWSRQRTFVASTLRRFIAGKKLIDHITEEAHCLLDSLQDSSGGLVDPKEFFWYGTINVALTLLSSRKFSIDDKDLHAIGDAASTGFQKYSDAIFLLYNFPYLRFVPAFGRVQKEYIESNEYLFDVFRRDFREHEKTFDENDIRDIMDAFIAETKKNGFHKSFNERQMSVLARDLLDGATHTTTSTLRWLMVALLKHSEYQQKLRDEINAVVGENGSVTAAHREEMPMTAAFISEVMRRCSILASAQTSTSQDVVAAGYKIPKGTPIALIMWSIHHDPKYFTDPFKFLPERFINPDTGKYVKPRHFVPFALGRRNCVGDSVAQLEIFVFLVSILQRFELLADDLSDIPEFQDGKCGVIYLAPPFKMRFRERQ